MILEVFERKPPVKPSAVAAAVSHFAWMRTRLSIERTLMAWVRTSTALIAFGFAIFQFFDRLNQMPGVLPPRNPGTARLISLALMAIGIFALIVAVAEYRMLLKYLWNPEFKDIAGIGVKPMWTPAFSVAILIAGIGLIAFVGLLIRTAQH